MRKTLIIALVAVTFVGSNCYGQSFKDKLKAKAAAASKPGGNAAGAVKGGTTIHLMEAERGNTKLQLEEGENNGRKILAINGAMYTWQDEPSATLGKKIYFSTAGLYVMEYDANSWVSVMPDKQLGKGEFTKFMFSNFYSSDAAKVKTMTKAKVEAYASDLSKQIMAPSASGPSKGGNGTYSAATPIKFAGNAYEEMEVTFEEGAVKNIIIKLIKSGKDVSTDTYMHMPEFSKLIGTEIYANSRSHLNQYIFVDKPGVLIWAQYKHGGLGNQLWEKYDYYNVYAMDKQVVRGIIASEAKQKEIDAKVANWSKTIKDVEDKRRAAETADKIANQRLPKEGMVDNNLKAETLAAAQAWAASWKWVETVTKAYFTGADWYIVRHKLTGIILRREIRGVIVMSRPDGMCSFHYAVFAQEYDGSKYNKVYTAGITPGQIKLNCEHAK
ncbi:hypothetical protein FRY74_06800 [Vicingus serpentipes]|uniref:Uncharacterized protein n=1 Tax=Vicingus serpentipes TaxID=1926625 RepID=A0A5C6RTY6_9FLAO|nr:hypothetical protein [Vicingus serpentipes]TXB65130.1 hypothetical protein FRY74_06800 [Vicingus serpentipes]